MPSRLPILTFWSLLALIAGLAIGLLGHSTGGAGFQAAAEPLRVLGEIWLSALQLLTLPLAITLVLAAISNARSRDVGGLTLRAFVLYSVFLLGAGLVTLPLTWGLLGQFVVTPETAAALSRSVTVPDAALAAAAPSAGDWLRRLLPANLFEAAATGQIFPLLLFAIAFGLAVTRLPDAQRHPLSHAFRGLADAMLQLVGWVLVVTPVGVFALGYLLALETGANLAGVLGRYLLIQPGVTVIWILLLYPITSALTGIGMGALGRALLPAQVIAASTRASTAALPALITGAREQLRLSDTATGFLLPLGVSLFRLSIVVQDTVKLVFLAHLYDVPLPPATLAAFLLTVTVLSFSSTGTPSSGGGSAFKMVPVFAAAGIPIQGVILLEVVETIPDVFATVLNVSGQLSATSILARWSRRTPVPARDEA